MQVLARHRRIGLISGISLLAFDALFLILFAANSGDDQDPPAHPTSIAAIVAVIAILFEFGAALCLYKVLKHWNIKETDIYKILTEAPHQITGLTRHTFESHAPRGQRRRQNMIELSVDNRIFRLSVNGEQFVSLKQYIAIHNLRAWYREEAHHV